mmetsp:Transcript_968/g.2873  ORF Transcript_968/g.2873 Transcript_968/m.2873 type:complete len:83 (-) Transcript_968:83-331(-)
MLERPTLAIYRDCLRLAAHIGGRSAKGLQLRAIARDAFRKHKNETDPQRIEQLRADAVRALSNYLVMKTLKRKPDAASASKR